MKLQPYGKGWERDGQAQTLAPRDSVGLSARCPSRTPQQPSRGWERRKTGWAGPKQRALLWALPPPLEKLPSAALTTLVAFPHTAEPSPCRAPFLWDPPLRSSAPSAGCSPDSKQQSKGATSSVPATASPLRRQGPRTASATLGLGEDDRFPGPQPPCLLPAAGWHDSRAFTSGALNPPQAAAVSPRSGNAWRSQPSPFASPWAAGSGPSPAACLGMVNTTGTLCAGSIFHRLHRQRETSHRRGRHLTPAARAAAGRSAASRERRQNSPSQQRASQTVAANASNRLQPPQPAEQSLRPAGCSAEHLPAARPSAPQGTCHRSVPQRRRSLEAEVPVCPRSRPVPTDTGTRDTHTPARCLHWHPSPVPRAAHGRCRRSVAEPGGHHRTAGQTLPFAG